MQMTNDALGIFLKFLLSDPSNFKLWLTGFVRKEETTRLLRRLKFRFFQIWFNIFKVQELNLDSNIIVQLIHWPSIRRLRGFFSILLDSIVYKLSSTKFKLDWGLNIVLLFFQAILYLGFHPLMRQSAGLLVDRIWFQLLEFVKVTIFLILFAT